MSAGTGLMAAGGLLGAYGAFTQGQETADVLERQASIQRQNAIQSIIASKINADRSSLLATKAIGQEAAGYSAAGVDTNSGSVLAVLGASAANAELDRQNILHGGQIRAMNYTNQANLDDLGADHSIKASYFNAAASLFGAGGKMATGMSAPSGISDVNDASSGSWQGGRAVDSF